MVTKFDSEQARAIRVAQESGRVLSAWSATVTDGAGGKRIAIVIAVTSRAALSLASSLGGVIRVGPAHVRDLQAAIDRALARRPEPQGPLPVVPSERERARVYLKGLGDRPGDPAVNAVLGRAVVCRVAGQPKRAPTVGVPRQPGAPFVGEYTLTGGRHAA